MPSTHESDPSASKTSDNRNLKPGAAVDLSDEALKLVADWAAARNAGQKSRAEFIRARFRDPKVAGRMRARLDAALKALRDRPA